MPNKSRKRVVIELTDAQKRKVREEAESDVIKIELTDEQKKKVREEAESDVIKIPLTDEQKDKIRESSKAAKFQIEEIEVRVIPDVRVGNHPTKD